MVVEESVAGADSGSVGDSDASRGVRTAKLPGFVGDFFGAKSGSDAGDGRQSDVMPLEDSTAHAIATDGFNSNDRDLRETMPLQALNDADVEPAAADRAHLLQNQTRWHARSKADMRGSTTASGITPASMISSMSVE